MNPLAIYQVVLDRLDAIRSDAQRFHHVAYQAGDDAELVLSLARIIEALDDARDTIERLSA